MVPCSRGLFESVDGFAKFTDVIGMIPINEAQRLGHIDIFSESALKKGIVDVKLSNSPMTPKSKAEYRANYRGFNHGAKGFMKGL